MLNPLLLGNVVAGRGGSRWSGRLAVRLLPLLLRRSAVWLLSVWLLSVGWLSRGRAVLLWRSLARRRLAVLLRRLAVGLLRGVALGRIALGRRLVGVATLRGRAARVTLRRGRLVLLRWWLPVRRLLSVRLLILTGGRSTRSSGRRLLVLALGGSTTGRGLVVVTTLRGRLLAVRRLLMAHSGYVRRVRGLRESLGGDEGWDE